ncbi:hypothetical protein Tb10.70.2820 [Trypanosoma brucei brucei TREU927]|uniref:Uncharacterized protein n=1 Tax=Trypanosoma brucei brucei (strain 927/4 GUTat10.1) TaxID=185431 RepID=Q38BF9_TRYB2|nr:hypothetical protein Tb10.70.2820 [Trypanosoma brucei brucei TREU927]EAN77861.1 hypothetical protein Tb10.70.2820 [Trypanosoma brucei brucei TREU927]
MMEVGGWQNMRVEQHGGPLVLVDYRTFTHIPCCTFFFCFLLAFFFLRFTCVMLFSLLLLLLLLSFLFGCLSLSYLLNDTSLFDLCVVHLFCVCFVFVFIRINILLPTFFFLLFRFAVWLRGDLVFVFFCFFFSLLFVFFFPFPTVGIDACGFCVRASTAGLCESAFSLFALLTYICASPPLFFLFFLFLFLPFVCVLFAHEHGLLYVYLTPVFHPFMCLLVRY